MTLKKVSQKYYTNMYFKFLRLIGTVDVKLAREIYCKSLGLRSSSSLRVVVI